MLSEETVVRIASSIAPLGAALYEAQAVALAEAATRCHGWSREEYGFLWSHVTRVAMREALSDTRLPEPWRLGGNPRQSGQLLLEHDEMVLRYLKECPGVFPGGVPAAGHTRARRVYFQPSLLTDNEGQPADADGRTNLLLLWNRVDPGDEIDAVRFTLRVVHPTATGKYGSATPTDLNIPVDPGVELGEGLRFVTDPQETMFFLDEDVADEDSAA